MKHTNHIDDFGRFGGCGGLENGQHVTTALTDGQQADLLTQRTYAHTHHNEHENSVGHSGARLTRDRIACVDVRGRDLGRVWITGLALLLLLLVRVVLGVQGGGQARVHYLCQWV